MTVNELIQFIYDYADEHYEDGGWDVISECYSPLVIKEILVAHKVENEKQAIAAFSDIISVYADRQADARNSAF
jgi:hypothetical protein